MRNKLPGFFGLWFVILLLNQIFIFGGCFAPYCLLAALPHTGIIAFFWTSLVGKSNKESGEAGDSKTARKPTKKESHSRASSELHKEPVQDSLKKKGDLYEKFIGERFEKKGDLVIYNGFIREYEDQGVDVITISIPTNTINLIQCKNWDYMRMTLEHMEDIYSKLENYDFDCFTLPVYQINEHVIHAEKDKIATIMATAKLKLHEIVIRKTLYIASEKVVDLEVGPYLTMMSPTIFKYKDMKIVMKGVN